MMYMVHRDTLIEIYNSVENLKRELKSRDDIDPETRQKTEKLIQKHLGWISELCK